ncbi:hypothetical protein ACIPEQ_13455 [Curtobacterium sp. NPDC087080]
MKRPSSRYRWGVRYRHDSFEPFAIFVTRDDADRFVASDVDPGLLEVIEL